MSKLEMCLSFLLLLYSEVHPLITISIAAAANEYKPTENIAIDCGSNVNSLLQADQRTWIGDETPSTLFTIIQPGGDAPSANAAEDTETRSLISNHSLPPVPYSTARISRHQFAYIFPVTPGPKFLRLHFYPASYGGGFDRSSGLFSVVANGHTLLTNFSVSLAVDNGDKTSQAFLSREFCICIAHLQVINITFAPSLSPSTPNAYAFINGIEIVSMPAHLYYSADGDHGVVLAGQMNQFLRVESSMALETMFRLNVGGPTIEPQDDTGIHRKWPNDGTYMPEQDPDISSDIKIEFTNQTPSYVAPAKLYQTARTMGSSSESNRNLTWTLRVDVGFTYLVRLHFCEIEETYNQTAERVFQIYIGGQRVEQQADVLVWTEKKGVPVYKDYGVVFTGEEGSSSDRNRSRDLNVSLYPYHNRLSEYADAILNGLEVFKINSSNGSLAAPIPIPTSAKPPILPSNSSDGRSCRHNRTVIAAAAASGGGATLVVFSLLGLYLLIIRRRKPTVGRAGTGLPSGLCRRFSVAEIRAATNNLDRAVIVGRGGFGDVYLGHIDGGATAVAIKRLKRESNQGTHEFKTEIEMLSRLRHLHLVSLIGYCNDGGEMMLVYAYVSRGTLRDHLYSTHRHHTPRPHPNPEAPLPWKRRLTICLGAARGLHHLHRGAKHTIIHRDVKTTNILLDDKWVAKVSDFGLSKVGPSVGNHDAHVTTLVKGSHGYVDPEYFRRQQLTEKSDVYSFGVVLLEVLFGRPPVDQSLPRDQVSLAVWARANCGRGTLSQIVDPQLDGQIATAECLSKFAEIAMGCLRDEGTQRPQMEHVVGGLELVLQLQEEAEHKGIKGVDLCRPVLDNDGGERVLLGSDDDGHASEWVVTPSSSSVRGSSDLLAGTSTAVEDSERLLSGEGAVFSEIINPNAR